VVLLRKFRNMKIKLTKEQQELLNNGNVVITSEGNEYLNLPFWYKREKNGLFSVFLLDEPPKDLFYCLVNTPMYALISKKNYVKRKPDVKK